MKIKINMGQGAANKGVAPLFHKKAGVIAPCVGGLRKPHTLN